MKNNTSEFKKTLDIREIIRKAINSQKQPTKTVLSSLLAIEDAISYIPDEAVEETAAFCNVSINDVWSVASFYTNFRFTPPGEKMLDVCWGPSCHLVGAQEILKSVASAAEVSGEGESPDRKLTVRYNTCLGACAQGPCIAVDHKVLGFQTPGKVKKLIKGLRTKIK